MGKHQRNMPRRRESDVVLFARGSQDDDSTADDWDDTELLKEYDRAVRPLKALVAERMGLSNAELEEASATESCASSRSALEKQASKTQKRNKKRKGKSKNKQHREWAVGEHCQAMFSVDNKWYEATIISLDHDQATCTVQYVGYGNTEEQPISALAHSMGAAVRREQTRSASVEKDSDTEVNQSDDMERSSQGGSFSQPKGQKNKHAMSNKIGESSFSRVPHLRTNFENQRTQPPNFDKFNKLPQFPPHPVMQDMVPPPLPPHVLSGLPSDDSEALSAMLMSWYMSGFHTGYYQGLKRAKSSSSPSHTN